MSAISRADVVRLQHMLDAAQKAQEFTHHRTRPDLDTDEMLSLAMVRLIEIVGEAASRTSDQIKQDNPQISWSQISGTRSCSRVEPTHDKTF